MHLLSKKKIDDLKKELKALELSLINDNEEQTRRGGPMDSYKEAAAFSVSKAAKEEIICNLKTIIENSKVLPDVTKSKLIVLGAWFELIWENKIVKKYRLVDPIESDPNQAFISFESPLGKAVIGRTVGDEAGLNNKRFKVLKIY